ncbi:aminopeptidase N [Lepeophtheirus salmonis]|uniref:aminopeptidase N n=1 Tax=Lepeophtheirus salmonis TaxID=72036 RepID=UPI003AF40469
MYTILELSDTTERFETVADFIKNKIPASEGKINNTKDKWIKNKADVKIALDFRLPHHIQPTSYDIQLSPQYGESNKLSGVVKIEVECVMEGSKNITLHSKLIHITRLLIKEKISGNKVKITNLSYGEAGTDLVIINMPENLRNGSAYIMTMYYTTLTIVKTGSDDYEELDYNSEYNYDSSYYSSYDFSYDTNSTTATKDIATVNNEYGNDQGFFYKNGVYYTVMEPIYARTVFPCFDEPSFKSVFNITLRRPKNMTSISNMPISQTITPENASDFVLDIFKSTPLMSSYLVAFVITNYTNEIIPTNNSLELRIWSSEEDKLKTCWAKRVSPTLYEYLVQYFGTNLPIPKEDLIAVPALQGAGALENWGLTTFQSKLLMIEENVKSIRSLYAKDEIVVTIAHEFTHQWMGDIVTPSWWDDLWLKEGTTTYVSYLASSEFFSWDRFVIFVFQRSMRMDSTDSPQSIKKNIMNNGEIFHMYNPVTYERCAAIIRMLSGVIGEEELQKVFQSLMQKYKLKNIDEDMFWKEIDEVISSKERVIPQKVTIKVLMGPWLTQTGYPVITVSPNFKKGSIQISQESIAYGSSSKKRNENVWWVPLKYNIKNKHDNGTIRLIWLNDTKLNQTYHDEDLTNSSHCLYPVIFNINQTGYYRINYNDENWKRITLYLRRNYTRIYKYNRVQLIDDSFSLAIAGYITYLVPFKITKYLPNEDEPLIWLTFFKKLSEITSKIFSIEIQDKIKIYLRNITLKLFDKYQKEYSDSKDFLQKKLWQLSTQWSCKFGNPKCVNISIKAVEEWMKDINKVPNVDIFETLVCTAIQEGNESMWDFVASQSASTNDPNKFIASLACSKNVSIIEKYLHMTRENQTFNSKASIVYDKVCETQIGRSVFIDFLKVEFDQIMTSRNTFLILSVRDVVYKVLELSNNSTRFEEVAKFMKRNSLFSKVEINIRREQWIMNQANVKIVNDWIQENITSF